MSSSHSGTLWVFRIPHWNDSALKASQVNVGNYVPQYMEEILGDRPVDLIEMEVVGESLRRAIERYGVEL